MKYKITGDIDISGKGKGDVIEAEPHAMELYLERGEIKVEKKIKTAVKKTVKNKK